MKDETLKKIIELEGTLGELVDRWVCNELSLKNGIAGLTWSPGMPDDDPDAELLVIDADGVEYVLDIDIDLSPTGRKRGGVVDIELPAEKTE